MLGLREHYVFARVDTRNGSAKEAKALQISRNRIYLLILDHAGRELGRRIDVVNADGISAWMESAAARTEPGKRGLALLEDLLDDGNKEIQKDAIELAADWGAKAAALVPRLVRFLDQTKGRTSPAWTSVGTLGAIGVEAKAALPRLMQIARREGLPSNLRQRASIALGKLDPKGAAVLPVLIECLEDRDESLVIGASIAIAAIGKPAKRALLALDAAYLRCKGPTTRSYIDKARASLR